VDEFGETPAFYIWPAGHEEGQPFPEDFYARVDTALRAAGFECETT
jgi:hypothetical protein